MRDRDAGPKGAVGLGITWTFIPIRHIHHAARRLTSAGADGTTLGMPVLSKPLVP